MSHSRLTVNGESVTADVEPRTHLADFLRETRLLTGTHLGCEHGVCGACTLLIDGAPARSCIAFAVACDGADVRTIEGLENDAITVRLRAAFTASQLEEVRLGGRELFIHFPDGQADTRLCLPAMKAGTARNMNTVAKLAVLAQEMG